MAPRPGYFRNLGCGKPFRPRVEFMNLGSATMPLAQSLGGSPPPLYKYLPALVPGACPVTPSHDSDPMSQPFAQKMVSVARGPIDVQKFARVLTVVEPETALAAAARNLPRVG